MKVTNESFIIAPLQNYLLGKDIHQGVKDLMSRPPSQEINLPSQAGGPVRELMQKLGLDPHHRF